MLDWAQLLNEQRRKRKLSNQQEDSGTKGTREESERDFDRVLFANPTRRLADKTQVFPLEVNDSVRNRLTHSYEVSNLCRSVGMRLAYDHGEEVFGADHEKLGVKRKVPAILATIGLAHDLGNPPFGHQGEVAMKGWFETLSNSSETNPKLHQDFLHFDGNPQTFRLLSKLQILNDDYGLNLTYGTLAALIKYPWLSDSSAELKIKKKKFGVFASEKEVAEDVWRNTGLSIGIRHPLTYIMEACDDIAFRVLDAEDIVKKGYASFYDLLAYLQASTDSLVSEVAEYCRKKNIEFQRENLTPAEINEISMQMFRVKAIYLMIESITECFVSNSANLMLQKTPKTFELTEESGAKELCKILRKFDEDLGFSNKNVYRLELLGNNVIVETMDMLWSAISNPDAPFSRYAKTQISENYKRAHGRSGMDKIYANCQLLADTISGMTDNYLLATHKNLKKLYRPK